MKRGNAEKKDDKRAITRLIARTLAEMILRKMIMIGVVRMVWMVRTKTRIRMRMLLKPDLG